ncbi:MAG: hypothetical protein IJ746_01870 [Ruminococcus sp.]|nr:hypothetical protein [Ruminococcus sp.]
MMDNLILGSLITANGKSTFSGLYDENGDPVKIVLEKDGGDVMLAVFADGEDDQTDDDQPRDCGISDEEFDKVCQLQADCNDCPLRECCDWEEDEDND